MPKGTALTATNSHEQGGDYRVVVFAAPSVPTELSDVLQRELHLHPTDARIHAHALPGILLDRLPQHTAETLAAAIESLGIACEVLHKDDIPVLDDAEAVHHARCADGGFEVFDLQGETGCIVPWGQIDLLSIGDVPGDPERIYQGPEIEFLHAGPVSPQRARIIPTATGPEAWIAARGDRLFRIEHAEMNYESLAERMTMSSASNFRTFITDVAGHVPHAYLTPSTRAYLEHGFARHFLFASREEFQRYTQFHILLQHRMRH